MREEIYTGSDKDVLGIGESAIESVLNTNKGRAYGYVATSKQGKTVTTKLDFSGGKTSGKQSSNQTTGGK